MSKEQMVRGLYDALIEQIENKPPVLAMRTLSEGDRQRQGLALTKSRYFISVLDKHILERTQAVVFVIEVTDDYYLLKFCYPLTAKEHDRLAALNYALILRAKHYLTVGQERSSPHAYASIRLSPYSSVMDFFDGLFVLGRELEKFIAT
jgi:hypothetical protein